MTTSWRLASVAAALVVAALVAPLTSSATTSTATVPKVQWTNLAGAGGDLWLAGEYQCGSYACFAIERSTDGGSTFRRVGAPRTGFAWNSGASGDISGFDFADSRDGYMVLSNNAEITRKGGTCRSPRRSIPTSES